MRIDSTDFSVAVDRAGALVKRRQIEFDGDSGLRPRGYRAEADFAGVRSPQSDAGLDRA